MAMYVLVVAVVMPKLPSPDLGPSSSGALCMMASFETPPSIDSDPDVEAILAGAFA